MTDPRLLRANGRVAHVSLRGQVSAERFVEGARRQTLGHPFLHAKPDGPRTRQLLWGDSFFVLEVRAGWAFGYAGKDGYVGWLEDSALAPPQTLTHRVTQRMTWANTAPDVKSPGRELFSLNARVRVVGQEGHWAKITLPDAPSPLYLPANHLAPLDQPDTDPVRVAEGLLGTPYVWAGNTALGIDCSGLVQAALRACAIPCPADSDMQMSLGLPAEGPPRRGDLVFWKGHVAMMVDSARLIHANAHDMAVAYEPLDAATARIKAQGDGPVIARRRLV